VNTYNMLKLQYGDYAQIIRSVRSTSSWRERAGYVFGPPGWTPSTPATAADPVAASAPRGGR
jgi:hypothetical protein